MWIADRMLVVLKVAISNTGCWNECAGFAFVLNSVSEPNVKISQKLFLSNNLQYNSYSKIDFGPFLELTSQNFSDNWLFRTGPEHVPWIATSTVFRANVIKIGNSYLDNVKWGDHSEWRAIVLLIKFIWKCISYRLTFAVVLL